MHVSRQRSAPRVAARKPAALVLLSIFPRLALVLAHTHTDNQPVPPCISLCNLPCSLWCCRYLNTCFDQGSRTIRSEEAILISLAFLQPAIGTAQRRQQQDGPTQ